MYLQVAVNIHIYHTLKYATPDETTEDHCSPDDNALGLIFSEVWRDNRFSGAAGGLKRILLLQDNDNRMLPRAVMKVCYDQKPAHRL